MAALPSAHAFARPPALFVTHGKRHLAPATAPATTFATTRTTAAAATSISSGHRALDRELPRGGWPTSVLIELLLARPCSGELSLLAPVLKQLTRNGKSIVLLAPPQLGLAATLEQLGIDRQRVLILETDKPGDRIWAVEQAMKNPDFGALLCWLPDASAEHLRRLQQAAASSHGLCMVFRPQETREQTSPALLRLVCQPAPQDRLSVDIIKRRGPVYGKPMLLPLTLPAPQLTLLPQRTMMQNTLPDARRITSRGTTLALVS